MSDLLMIMQSSSIFDVFSSVLVVLEEPKPYFFSFRLYWKLLLVWQKFARENILNAIIPHNNIISLILFIFFWLSVQAYTVYIWMDIDINFKLICEYFTLFMFYFSLFIYYLSICWKAYLFGYFSNSSGLLDYCKCCKITIIICNRS